jgi:tRNA(Ile)-lysidine synthase
VLFAPLAPFATLILAVSGGADSMALLHLVVRWAKRHPRKNRKIVVATIDHGLRPGSRREAEWVGEAARALGLTREILTWRGQKPATGVQEAAREARYRLLSELAQGERARGTVGVLTAHTEDDQAETFLMRLARGSGLDGLAAMSASRPLDGDAACQLVRPLLAVPGARLKATLQAAGLSWIEDPSNDSERFERVRLRGAKEALAALGLSPDALALSAQRLARVRAALEHAAGALQTAAQLDLHGGAYASLEARAFLDAPEEVRLRLLARLIAAFGGRSEPVRLAKLESLVERMNDPAFPSTTLGGAMLVRLAKEIIVHREPGRSALPEIELPPGKSAEWDGRFRVTADAELAMPLVVAPLGRSGFAQLRQQLERAARLPARAAATLPAFWQGDRLLAVPTLAGLPWSSAVWSNQAQLCHAEFLW